MLLQDFIKIIVIFRVEQVFVDVCIMHLTKDPFERGTKYCERKRMHILQKAKAHFKYAIWFMISEKHVKRKRFFEVHAWNQKSQQGNYLHMN